MEIFSGCHGFSWVGRGLIIVRQKIGKFIGSFIYDKNIDFFGLDNVLGKIIPVKVLSVNLYVILLHFHSRNSDLYREMPTVPNIFRISLPRLPD